MQQFLSKIFQKRKTIAFLAGSLSVQALPPFYHSYILFFTTSWLLYAIHQASNKKQAFALGYWFGFGFFAFGFAWVNNALLVFPEKTGWLIPITFLASGGFMGLFIAFPSLLSKLNKTITSQYLSWAAWIVIFEWIRSWFLTGFPWNLWGTCLAFNIKLIQLSSVIGTYGLSLILLLTASAPVLWLVGKNLKNALKTASIILLCTCTLYAFGHFRISRLEDNTSNQITIRLVQPEISQNQKWSLDLRTEHFQKYIKESQKQPLNNNSSIIVWGETASPFPLDMDKNALTEAIKILPPEGYLVTGQIRLQDNYYNGWDAYNSSLIINSQGVIEDFYDKTHLVPFGEYIPLRQWLPEFIRPVANVISTLKAGNGPKIINIPNIPPFGIQICYEIIFPHQIINPSQKPEWVINLTNDGWYGLSSGPYQHLVNTQLRAVEEGITIVRSANNGISALINRYGKIVDSLSLHQVGSLDIALPQKTSVATIYNTLGNIPILTICLLLIVVAFLYPHILQKQPKTNNKD